jgi:hypothetical protein
MPGSSEPTLTEAEESLMFVTWALEALRQGGIEMPAELPDHLATLALYLDNQRVTPENPP